MAWATKYRCEFIDNGGLVWKWDFQWDGYSGDVIDMQGTGDPGMYEALSDTDDILDNPIKGTQVKLKVYAEENLDYEDFFTVKDMEVKCLIYAGSNLFFSGYVQSRTYSEPYDGAPYWVEITAICGLALLKNHKYDDSGSTYYGHEFISAIIMDDILDKIDYNKFHEIINIYDSDINSAVGDSPLDQILLDRIRFADMSCYEVLSYILMSFNAVIRQAEGVFYIYRPLELRHGTSYCRTYTTSTLKSDSTIDVVIYIDSTGTATELHSHNGGVKMLLIPAKKIILHQDLGYKESWLKNYKFDSIDLDLSYGLIPTHWEPTNITSGCIYPVSKYDPSSKGGIAIGPYNTYPALSKYIAQEIGDNAIVAAGDVMILEFEYQWFNFEASAKAPQFYFSVVAGLYSLDEKDGSYAEWVTPATNMSIRESVDPGSSGWQSWKRIISSLDVNGPITVTLYCLDNTDDISIGIKNIHLTVVSDSISIKKTYKRNYGNPRKRYSSWRFDYQREYTDIAEVVQKDIKVTNSIEGDEIERDYIIGDVLNSDVNINNITEQFSGATVRAVKQYRVDEITLTGTSGRARVTVNRINATAVWATDLTATAALFVTTYATLYDAANITLTSSGATLIFTSQVLGMEYEGDSAVLNLEGDLDGTVAYTTAGRGSVLYPTTEWARRGVSEATGLLKIIAAEVAEQRSRVRQFLSLPVWDMYSGDTDPHISPIGIYIDPINYISPPGTLARQFAFLRGYYDMLNRHWDIDIVELVDNTVPDGDPSSLTATADGSDTIDLAWSNGSSDEDGISIERSLDEVTWVEIDTVAATETSYSDTSCEELTTYYYRVRAFKNIGYSDYSNTDSDTTAYASSYDADLLTYIAGLTTELSSAQLVKINDFIKDYKADDSLTNLSDAYDVMYYLGNETAESSLRNMVKRAHDATAVNSPTFTPYEGWQGDGISSYIDTNYSPATQGVNYVLYDASFGFYSRTIGNGIPMAPPTNVINTRILFYFGNRIYWSINGAAPDSYHSYSDANGMYVIGGDNLSSKSDLYRNKIVLDTTTSSQSTVGDGNFWLLGRGTYFSTKQLSFAFAGKYLDSTSVGYLTDDFEALMDANGKGVIV